VARTRGAQRLASALGPPRKLRRAAAVLVG
jgi:hypothetical protein